MSCAAELISGGRSNLTFLVFDDASKWVLRRPPLHGLTPSAHDMAREYKVVAALADTPVPVARAVTMRNDDSVLGAPFQMVDYVPGRVSPPHRRTRWRSATRTRSTPVSTRSSRCWPICTAVDPEAVGLGDFGKPTGYLERQVRRWGSQWDLVKTEDDPRDADVRLLHAKLGRPRCRRRAAARSCTATTASTTRCSTRRTPPRCGRFSTGRCRRWATRSATPR